MGAIGGGMKPRAFLRISPFKKLKGRVATDSVCFTGLIEDLCGEGACLRISSSEPLPIYPDNRLVIRCCLGDLDGDWADEVIVGKVRWIRMQDGETRFGVEFLNTDEYYHPRISSLTRSALPVN